MIDNIEDNIIAGETLKIPSENIVEFLSNLATIDTFFEEFTREVSLANLDDYDLCVVRVHFTLYKQTENFEKISKCDMSLPKFLLLHTSYNFLLTSNSLKSNKLKLFFTKIFEMTKKDKPKKNFLGKEVTE